MFWHQKSCFQSFTTYRIVKYWEENFLFVKRRHSFLSHCSSSKPDQVIYSGVVKSREKVEEFQEEIGPEIVQTIKVGLNHILDENYDQW